MPRRRLPDHARRHLLPPSVGFALGGGGMGPLGTTRVSAAAFTPASIAGLALWLKADAITGLSDGDPVATWPDASGHGRDATQATGSLRPLYRTAGANGKPYVRCDGVDDYLLASSVPYAQPYAIFAVVRQAGWAGGGRFWDGNAGGGSDFGCLLQANASPDLYLFDGAGVGPVATLAVGAWGALRCVYAGAASLVQHDANAAVTGALAGAGPHTAFVVGNRNGFNGAGQGDFAEICLYSAVPSDADAAALTAYLTAKYAL